MASRKELRGGHYFVSIDDGMRDILNKLVLKKEQAATKALREGAKHMADVVEKHTPVGKEPRRKDKYGPNTPYSMTRLKDDVKWQKRGDEYVVGYGMDTHWRAVFVNNGTIKLKGQFFFEKAVQEGTPKTIDIVREVALEEWEKLIQ